jgi:hypothetical protein
MKRISHLLISAVVAACGGSAVDSTPGQNGQKPNTADYVANAPTFDKVALSQSDADENESAMTDSAALAPQTALQADAVPQGDASCHPHLFINTDTVIGLVNSHFFKMVRHVEDLIKSDPTLTTDGSKTWENVKNGVDRKLTVSAVVNADGSITYTFELDLADVVTPSTNETFVKVMSGTLTHSGPATANVSATSTAAAATVAIENKGTITFDYDALHTVIATENAKGQITDAFDNVNDPAHGVKRAATITLTNFVWDNWQFAAHGVRNGQYSWEREPGTGGFFQYTDAFVLNCPANPQRLVADVSAVARWYRATDGSVHGRTDAMATGGQNPAGDKWEGVTCATGRDSASIPNEGEWMMKEEQSDGTSIFFAETQVGLTPCDPVFGAVPDENDSTNDYDFTKAVTFPNEW